MTNLALVTGASSGIGRELAKVHAEKGGDLIVTARREAELNALKKEIEGSRGTKVHVMAGDISGLDGARDLAARVEKAGLEVDILINNAGFGGQGKHVERDLDTEIGMIDLNVDTLVALTHIFGGQMARRGKGRILNVGSTAGFAPGPNQAVYFATKAFVNSFSQAIDAELRPQGVTCTVLAPGYVETEFADRADLHGTTMVKQGGASAADVARHGYAAMENGELVTINQPSLSFMLNWVAPLMPRRMLLNFIGKSQSKS